MQNLQFITQTQSNSNERTKDRSRWSRWGPSAWGLKGVSEGQEVKSSTEKNMEKRIN